MFDDCRIWGHDQSMAKKQTPEQLVQKTICEWLAVQPDCLFWVNKTQGTFDPRLGIFRKNNGKYARNGVSDIIGIWDGTPLAIEVKSKHGKPSPDQTRFLTDFKAHGGIAFIGRSIEDCVKHLLGAGCVVPAVDGDG